MTEPIFGENDRVLSSAVVLFKNIEKRSLRPAARCQGTSRRHWASKRRSLLFSALLCFMSACIFLLYCLCEALSALGRCYINKAMQLLSYLPRPRPQQSVQSSAAFIKQLGGSRNRLGFQICPVATFGIAAKNSPPKAFPLCGTIIKKISVKVLTGHF